MSETTELIAQQIMNGNINKRTWGDILYNVKVYGAKGDGVKDDTALIDSAIDAASISGGIVCFPPGTYKTGSLTVPANVTLWFTNGAKLSINSGATVTINGPIDAGLHQIFSGAGTVAGAANVLEVYPQWWGAKADGTNDDLAAITAAINYVLAQSSGGVVCLADGNYKISSAIVINSTKPLIIYGKGQSTTISGTTGFNAKIFDITNCPFVFRDFMVIGTVGQSNGIKATGCNTARFEGLVLQNQNTGIELNNSYSVEVNSCVFNVCYTYGIIATTGAHNLVIDKCNFYTCGAQNFGQAIRVNAASDNMVFINNSFEYCYIAFQLQDCTALTIENNYIEYCSEIPIALAGTCRGVSIDGNWIALGSQPLTIQNVVSGTMRRNTIYNQTVQYGSNVSDFIVGYNYKAGTGTLAPTKLNSVTLLNSWTQQTNYADVGYIKDMDGKVILEGNLINSVASLPSVAFTLPVGYRPNKTLTFSAAGSSGPCFVSVGTNGDVTVATAPGALKETGLNGISFFARG